MKDRTFAYLNSEICLNRRNNGQLNRLIKNIDVSTDVVAYSCFPRISRYKNLVFLIDELGTILAIEIVIV